MWISHTALPIHVDSLLHYRQPLPQPCVCVSDSVVSDSSRPHGLQPPGSSDHGILQARILQGVALPSSRGSSQPRDPTQASNPRLSHCRQSLYDLSNRASLTFIVIGKHTLICHNCPNLMLGFTLVVVHSMGLDKYIITHIHLNSIIHGILMPKKSSLL